MQKTGSNLIKILTARRALSGASKNFFVYALVFFFNLQGIIYQHSLNCFIFIETRTHTPSDTQGCIVCGNDFNHDTFC